MFLNSWVFNRIICNTAKLEFSSVYLKLWKQKKLFIRKWDMAISQKLLGGFFCHIPSVLIADISPLNVQDECTRVLFVCLLCTDLVLKEGKIIFILQVLQAVNPKCFSLHTNTKKVLKDSYRTAYFFSTIKRYNIALLSLKQVLKYL